MGERAADGGRQGVLPAPRTRFFGWNGALDELTDLVEHERLLSLVGPPGAGKTRLATEVAGRVAPRFAGGVRFVELAPLDAASGTAAETAVANAVGDALGVTERPDRPMADVLVETVAGSEPVLIVLDNCEHLVDGAAALGQRLVDTCPAVSLLATSRAALGVRSERVWSVPRLDRATAADLFLDRASVVWHGHSPFANGGDGDGGGGGDGGDGGDRAVVEDICALLDGIPLAVELTAAWTRVVAPRQILDRLVAASPELPGPARDGEPRHDTMAAAVDWSHRLLPAEARRLFEQLSVFAGGFDLAAVQAVAGGDRDVLAWLTLLVDNSLVLVEGASGGRMRYRMLEPVRQRAAHLLAAGGDEDGARRRHHDHYLRLGEAYVPWQQQTGRDFVRLGELAREEGNMRTALTWAERQPSDLALRLVVAWAAYVATAGRLNDGVRWFEDSLARGTDDDRLRARGLTECGYVLWRRGDYAAADRRLGEALDLARSMDDPILAADVLVLLSAAAFSVGRVDESARCTEEAIVLYAPGGSRSSAAGADELRRTRASMAHAWTHYARGDGTAGDELMRAALVTNKRYGNPSVSAYGHIGLAYGAALAGDTHIMRSRLQTAATGIDEGGIVERASWLGLALVLAVSEHRVHAALHLAGGSDTFGASRGGARTPTQLEERFVPRFAVMLEELSPALADRLIAEGRQMRWDELVAEALAEPGADRSPLSRREHEIADLVAEGLTNAGIAEKLVISRRTVDSHIDHIKRKLDLKSRSEIIVWVLRSSEG